MILNARQFTAHRVWEEMSLSTLYLLMLDGFIDPIRSVCGLIVGERRTKDFTAVIDEHMLHMLFSVYVFKGILSTMEESISPLH